MVQTPDRVRLNTSSIECLRSSRASRCQFLTLLAAGVTVGGLSDALRDPVAVGIVVALLLGKTVGSFGATWLMSRFTGAELVDELEWVDVLGHSVLAGIGFTVSLLIGELAFRPDSLRDERVKIGLLIGSLLAAVVGGGALRARNSAYRRIRETGSAGADADGVSDVFGSEA